MATTTHRGTAVTGAILLGASLAALLPVATIAAEPRPSEAATLRLDVPAEAFEHDRQDWYGIYADDNKLGYLRLSIRFDEVGEPRFVVENEMHLKVVTMGQKRQIRSVETLAFEGAAPFRLVAGRSVIDQGPYRQEVDLSRDGDRYEARILAADSERTLEVSDPRFTIADVLTPELWFREPRRPGDSLSTRSFSLADLESAVDTYSVRQLKDTLVDGVGVSYYEVDLHSSASGSIGTALIDHRGTLVSGIIGGAFELRLETAELAQDFDYSADVYLLGMAGIDQPLGDPGHVNHLLLEVEGDQPDRIPDAARQRLYYDRDSATWRLALGVGAEGDPLAATDPDIEAALAESVEHPIRDERIRELAREAIGTATDRRDQVEALVRFVDGYLVDSYSAEPLTVLDMLSAKQGDCTEHALLFSTLARSLGIPAREVTGLLYLGDDVRAFGGHAWNEVALDGFWHAVDPTWGETEINATHILLGPRTGDSASADALFGGYSFKLIDVERDAPPASP
jgi:hypothetical protein